MSTEQQSILDRLIDERPFGLISRVSLQEEPVICLGLDNGNDAAKLAVLTETGRVVSVRIPTAYSPQSVLGTKDRRLPYGAVVRWGLGSGVWGLGAGSGIAICRWSHA